MQRGGGEYDSLPLATVSAVLDMAPNKVVPILGGAGAGFKKQIVHGYKSFIKLLSPALVDPDDVNELKHEAEMYQVLEPLWGSYVPGLVYHGELERGKFALITTDEGESLATEEGFRLAQNGQDLLRVRAHEALSLVHDKGVLHGDVALRNIVVDSKYNVKVIDFGRATQVDHEDPKVQQAFAIEHAQLDADFSKYGIDVSGAESPPAIHYGEQKRPRSSEGMYKEQQQVHARKTALAPMEM
jgi:serine/threonine protein kinase